MCDHCLAEVFSVPLRLLKILGFDWLGGNKLPHAWHCKTILTHSLSWSLSQYISYSSSMWYYSLNCPSLKGLLRNVLYYNYHIYHSTSPVQCNSTIIIHMSCQPSPQSIHALLIRRKRNVSLGLMGRGGRGNVRSAHTFVRRNEFRHRAVD